MTRALPAVVAAVIGVAGLVTGAPRAGAGLPEIVIPPAPVVFVDPGYQVGLGTVVQVGLARGGAWGTPTAALADGTGAPIAATSVPMPFSGTPSDPHFFYSGALPLTAPDARCGANSIVVTLHPGAGPTNLTPVPYYVNCPAISADPAYAHPGDGPVHVTVSLTDFDPDGNDSSPRTLLLDGTTLGTSQAGEPVSFDTDPTCGAHTIEVQQQASTGATLDATTPWPVLCPGVVAAPDPVAKGLPVTLTATGFRPGLAITFTVSGAPIGTAAPDASGTASLSTDTRPLPCGTDPVVATQSDSGATPSPIAVTLTASTTFRVTCAAAVVAVLPGVLQLGTTGHVVGHGFLPSTALSLVWLWPGGRTAPVEGAPATTGPAGTVDFTTLLFALEPVGPRTLVVTDPVHRAQAAVLVDPSPMQPSGGLRLTLRH